MSIFYVYQGDTYKEERSGGYVWLPKLNTSGSKNIGYEMMTNVKKGDFIIHHCNGKIVAISVAKTNCYDSIKPSELSIPRASIDWNDEGYRIDTIYFDMDVPLIVTEHKAWLAANYKKGSAFTINGTGKQQYMCSIDNQQASYLLKKTLKLQKSEAVKDIIKSALVDINN